MKIDIFSHFCPMKYKEALYRVNKVDKIAYELKLMEGCATLFDIQKRFAILDKFECAQILTLISPPIEDIADRQEAIDLARTANDGIAETIFKYPQYFVGGVAALPLNDMDAALREIDRSIQELKLRGIQIYSSIQGKPLDDPEFFPLFEKMASYNLPIWLHPWRTMRHSDYQGESESKYKIWSTFGWPYETSAAMTRLIFSGIFDKLPGLKIITHHAGGMTAPLFERVRSGFDLWEMRTPIKIMNGLSHSPSDYYRMFYCDTATAGQKSNLMCAHDFFGADHMLFGTDMPMDSQIGYRLVRKIISAIERMEISETEKQKIFEGNARRLIRLPI